MKPKTVLLLLIRDGKEDFLWFLARSSMNFWFLCIRKIFACSQMNKARFYWQLKQKWAFFYFIVISLTFPSKDVSFFVVVDAERRSTFSVNLNLKIFHTFDLHSHVGLTLWMSKTNRTAFKMCREAHKRSCFYQRYLISRWTI